MGNFAGKLNQTPQLDNSVDEQNSSSTPKPSKVLPFDPRSPSTNVSRTPITVTDTPNSKPISNVIKPLLIDPRSPTNEMTRTPMLVEEPAQNNRKLPLRPSNFVVPQDIDENDPRSPTSKVPRTPVQDHPLDDSITDSSSGPLNKKLFPDSPKEKLPLTVQNNGPRDQMKALQCRNVEEEFTKNEKKLSTQLDADTIKSSTEFIQDI